MKRVNLEQALIDVMDVSPEMFESRRYFLYRQAAKVIKSIGGVNAFQLVEVVPVSNLTFKIPETSIDIKKVIDGNRFSLIPGRKYDYGRFKTLIDEFKTLRFIEYKDHVSLAHDLSLVTVIYEAMMTDEEENVEIYDFFIPAIRNFILYEQMKKESITAALKGGQNYYMLQKEEAKYFRLYHLGIVNARAELRFDEVEEKKDFNRYSEAPYLQAYIGNVRIPSEQISSYTTQAASGIGLRTWIGTQAEYDALGTYDSNTIYYITN
jgi:hypothetical protein